MKEITNVLIIYEDQTSLIYLSVMRQFMGCKMDSNDRICTKGKTPFTDTIQVLEETNLSWEQSCDFATVFYALHPRMELPCIFVYAVILDETGTVCMETIEHLNSFTVNLGKYYTSRLLQLELIRTKTRFRKVQKMMLHNYLMGNSVEPHRFVAPCLELAKDLKD